jgi:hypothetical protein
MAYQLQITTAQGIQMLPLDGVVNSSIPADPSASYTLLDEQGNAVMENLSLTKDGNNLSLEVDGESVANIEEFYSVDGSQYVIDGSAVPAENMVVSSAGVNASGSVITNGAVWQAESGFLGLSTLQLVGAGVGSAVVVGAAVAAGSDESSSSGSPADVTTPTITSGTTATTIDENTGAGQVIYTVTATDDNTITYSLSGDDASLFTIDSSTGEITLTADPDYETQTTYSFNVVATDEAGNESEQTVSLDINDIEDETAPTNTFTDAAYDETSNTLTLTGTDMNMLLSGSEDSSTDIKDNFDWNNLQWDISSDDTDNITFELADIESVYVTDDNTLAITLTTIKANELEATNRFDNLTEDDSIEITTGFSGDTAGNAATTDAYVGEAAIDTSIVVFNSDNGDSSSHSDRTFDADVSYTIYIIIVNYSVPVEPSVTWEGSSNLGSDDFVVLVSGNGNQIFGYASNVITGITYDTDHVTYQTQSGRAAVINDTGIFSVSNDYSSFPPIRLWTEGTNGNPDVQVNTLSGAFTLTTMPTGILTSQGLA